MIDTLIIKSFIKGLISFIPGVSDLIRKKINTKHSSSNAEFCYNFWFGLLIYLDENNINCDLSNIVELGNGNSIGIGYCALLTRADKYTAIDIYDYRETIFNVELFDEILKLIKEKRDIFIDEKLVNIRIKSKKFPEHLINYNLLDEIRINELREQIINKEEGRSITFIFNEKILPLKRFTFAFSRAVMEHVNDPNAVYNNINKILINKSLFINDIEFHSHGISSSIDGHLKINNFIWKIIFGKRDFFLNRYKIIDHQAFLKANNFKTIKINENSKFCQINSRFVLYGCLIVSEKNDSYC